jgi:predicted RNA-binding protein with TRAM domain
MSYGGRSNYGGSTRSRGYGSDRGFGGPKPVETGKEYDVQISEISRQGDGIARIQGFVIFVKGGKVGQKAKVKITNVGARFATAEIVSGRQQQQQQQPTTATTTAAPQEQKPKEIAPQVSEEEKPDLQDYKGSEEKQS